MKKGHLSRMPLIRERAIAAVLFDMKYPKKHRPASSNVRAMRIIDYAMKKTWRYGWNACASFVEAFPEGERLEAHLTGGIRIPV